jgi:hypothetical protein
MSATSVEEMTDTSLRARWNRRRRPIIALIAVVAAAGAFALWGPIGIGPGPIRNTASPVTTTGPVSRTQPAMFVVPIDAGNSGAVIDSVAVISDGSYPAPHVISVQADGDLPCGGAWPLTGQPNFYAACAASGLVPLLGRPVSDTSAAIKAAPPGPAGCWTATAAVIHYHIGIRHYTATHGIRMTVCWDKSKLAGLQHPA